jgi:putative two-component system response regulator
MENVKNAKSANSRKVIMLVDDNETNLKIGKDMLKEHYKVYPILSADILFDVLEDVYPDMILLDIEMPEMDGYEALKKLKGNLKWADVPVIFLTAKSEEGCELVGLSLGAVDYITKPFSAPLLLKRIENHLLTRAQEEKLLRFNDELLALLDQRTLHVLKLQTAVLSTVADLVEFRDGVTGGHISRTQQYLEILLDQMAEDGVYSKEISAWDMNFLLPSAQLHDVGKIAVSDAILNKPGKLTPEEFEIMKGHSSAGVEAIRRIEEKTTDQPFDEYSFLRHARLFAGGHHEKWDGSGYPAGLKGTDIPLEGRLMAIVDVYDALVSKRSYKRPFSTEEARRIIEGEKGTSFDPTLVDVFSKVADKFADAVKNSTY